MKSVAGIYENHVRRELESPPHLEKSLARGMNQPTDSTVVFPIWLSYQVGKYKCFFKKLPINISNLLTFQ